MECTQLFRLRNLVIFAVFLVPSPTTAAVVEVATFGDQGWKSDDTRDIAGTDLVGINNTHAGDPAVTPSAADDAAIANQIKFVTAPAGSILYGAVKIDGTSSNSGKSNISTISPVTGFGAASDLLGAGFFANYSWYNEPNPTSRTLGFKLGIQSAVWGTGAGQSQETFTATRSGESIWDLVLVHVPTTNVPLTWQNASLDATTGTWNLFRQAGNAFFQPAPDATAKTLLAWSLDPDYGDDLFGAGAKVTSVQFGLGSSQRQAFGYVDYLQTNLLNGGDLINFVPEPSSLFLGVLGALAVSCSLARRRRVAMSVPL